MAGELCIGGAALARGYLHEPEQTARAFVPDPCTETPGARLYRSGDLARYLPDGRLQFLGRIDQQLKVRGFRIEPGEIETALVAQPGVRSAVVLLREDLPGHPRLVAYVAAPPSATGLREALAQRLPPYMVPAAVVVLDELPLTAHGKVDRARLPSPEAVRPGGPAVVTAPRTPVERILAEVWRGVLRLEQVGIDDNFFEIGGDSILAFQIVAQAHRAGLRLTPRQIFQHQTIASLAAVAGTVAGAQTVAGPVSGPVPLTPIQCWFFERRLPAPHHFNQSLLMELLLPVSIPVWERALAWITEHHDALRLRFEPREEGWTQTALPPGAVAPAVTRIDQSALPARERDRAFEAAAGQVQAALDLAAGPLLRLVLFDLAAGGAQQLLIVAHHLIVDGVSWEILLADLEGVCRAFAGGAEPAPLQRTTSFKAWADLLVARVTAVETDLALWLAHAAEAPPPLPCDRVAGANDEAVADTVQVALSREGDSGASAGATARAALSDRRSIARRAAAGVHPLDRVRQSAGGCRGARPGGHRRRPGLEPDGGLVLLPRSGGPERRWRRRSTGGAALGQRAAALHAQPEARLRAVALSAPQPANPRAAAPSAAG